MGSFFCVGFLHSSGVCLRISSGDGFTPLIATRQQSESESNDGQPN